MCYGFIYLVHAQQWHLTPQSSGYYTNDEQYILINAYKEKYMYEVDTF